MRVLWIATKAPWPPDDGGRLVAALTLEELGRSCRVTIAHPRGVGSTSDVPPGCTVEPLGQRRGRIRSAITGTLRGRPSTFERYCDPAFISGLGRLARSGAFDIVHLEQPHPFPALRRNLGGARIVYRAHNVEHLLWRQLGYGKRLLANLLAQPRMVAIWERRLLERADATVTLTSDDARALRRLAAGARIETIPPPFPESLPAAEDLEGDPPVVFLGNPDWPPNRDARDWLLRSVWPAIRDRRPHAHLHLWTGGSGAAGPGTTVHALPRQSRAAFAANSVHVVPLRAASGIRMKILEAWARGIPVVASPTAARGLDCDDGVQLRLAEAPEDFARAVVALAESVELRRGLIAGGRQRLRERHEAGRVVADLLAVYESVLA